MLPLKSLDRAQLILIFCQEWSHKIDPNNQFVTLESITEYLELSSYEKSVSIEALSNSSILIALELISFLSSEYWRSYGYSDFSFSLPHLIADFVQLSENERELFINKWDIEHDCNA